LKTAKTSLQNSDTASIWCECIFDALLHEVAASQSESTGAQDFINNELWNDWDIGDTNKIVNICKSSVCLCWLKKIAPLENQRPVWRDLDFKVKYVTNQILC
jgi:hypothetical protein